MTDFINEYRSRVENVIPVSISHIRPGDLISFHHKNEYRIGMVIAPRYENKLHVLTFQNLPPDQVQQIRKDLIKITHVQNISVQAQEVYDMIRSQAESFNAYRSYLVSNISNLQKVNITPEGPLVDISFVAPNFELEWDAAKNFPSYFQSKEQWLKLANTGTTRSLESLGMIGNTDYYDGVIEDLERYKVRRFLSALRNKRIELPIIAGYGALPDLIAGNVRLVGLRSVGYSSSDIDVWYIDLNRDTESEESEESSFDISDIFNDDDIYG